MKHLRNLRRSRALVSTCGAVALLLVSGGVQAADTELPFGMSVDHLNLVVTASEVDATVEFYGDALGLERPGDWKMPSGSTMLRFLAGDSELKFIVPQRSSRPSKAQRGMRAEFDSSPFCCPLRSRSASSSASSNTVTPR